MLASQEGSPGLLDGKGKAHLVAHAFNPCSQEVEAGGLDIQGHSLLHGKFKARLSDMLLPNKFTAN